MRGLFTSLRELIGFAEDNKRIAIKIDDLVDESEEMTDLSEMTREELERKYRKAAAAVVLYALGYRSVIRGKGFYVNRDLCKKPEYVKRFFNNAKITAEEKEQIVDVISKDIADLPEYPQLKFDAHGRIYEELTEERLLGILEEDSKVG